MVRAKVAKWALIAIFSLLAGACGQTGPLYLPENSPESVDEQASGSGTSGSESGTAAP